MNARRILAVLAVALTVTAASGMALAQQQGDGMGQGMGQGMMMGQGQGQGMCPSGQGMGQGNMMGHAMGSGMMMGQGHGMMGGWPVPAGAKLSGDDVAAWLEHFLARTGNPNLRLGSVTEKDDYTVMAEIVTIDNSLVQRLEIDRRTGQRWQVE
jgi:hypothetical protein